MEDKLSRKVEKKRSMVWKDFGKASVWKANGRISRSGQAAKCISWCGEGAQDKAKVKPARSEGDVTNHRREQFHQNGRC